MDQCDDCVRKKTCRLYKLALKNGISLYCLSYKTEGAEPEKLKGIEKIVIYYNEIVEIDTEAWKKLKGKLHAKAKQDECNE